MENNIYLTVIIPVYNEEKRIPKTLKSTIDYLNSQNYKSEVIVVNDGSTDNTKDTVIKFEKMFNNVRFIEYFPNIGKGKAVKEGVLNAKGRYILYMDADLSVPLYEIGNIIKEVENGYDIVIGSRELDSSRVKIHQYFLREYLGKLFSIFVRCLVFKGIKDTQCGFKCFEREAGRRIFSRQRIYSLCFDVEILYLFKKNGLTISQIPVDWYNDPDTKVHPLKIWFSIFRDLCSIKNLHRKN